VLGQFWGFPEYGVWECMTASSTWFGPEDRPLAGWLHLPETGTARAGIVLCPSLGVEALVAQPAYLRLARRLETMGFAVLRFDYSATGDSSGSMEAGASIDQWVADVGFASDFIRSCGSERVGVVGLRVGATLAARSLVDHGGFDALAMWDPCATGRAFLREQQALKALTFNANSPYEEEEGLDLLSLWMPSSLAADLSALSLDSSQYPEGLKSLLVTRVNRPKSSQVLEWLECPGAEEIAAKGQEEFLDVAPGISVLPLDTIDQIAGWFDRIFDDQATAMTRHVTSEAVVAHDAEGKQIIEHLSNFGSAGLFGVVTEPAVDAGLPPVVLLNVGLLHHIGPGRLWVDVARAWAAEGSRVLRFDLGGIGESPAIPYRADGEEYPLEAVDDIIDAMRLVAPDDYENVILVGICSGAYHALETSIALSITGAAIINPILSFDPTEIREGRPLDTRRNAVQPRHGIVRWMRGSRTITRIAQWSPLWRVRESPRLAQIIDEWTPEFVWNLLDKTGIIRSGASVLEMIGSGGTSILLICGDREARTFRRAGKRIDALISAEVLTFQVLPGLDHSLFSAKSRRDTRRWLDGFVSAFGSKGSTGTNDLRVSTASAAARDTVLQPDNSEGGTPLAAAAELLAPGFDPESTA
jgi:alpha-beta hydrolase superfamily lysophospholipase